MDSCFLITELQTNNMGIVGLLFYTVMYDYALIFTKEVGPHFGRF
jgi:hypothetical protein